jgi:hypothetical protein
MKKPIFVLKNIDVDTLDKKYNIKNLIQKEENKVIQKTKISDITDKDENNFFSFLDESKKDHQCIFTMKQYINQEMFPQSTDLHCFWCRHSFPYRPIGCPIEYVAPRISKSYHSEITKDKYTLRENISPKQFKDMNTLINTEENNNVEYSIIENDFYLMDGLFCSFNCCLAYIKHNNTNPLYINSENLLNKIYYDCFGKKCFPLIEAPSWRLLKNYGGHMNIEEYRKNFYKINYFNVDNIIYPKTKCIGYLFEKQIKL